MILLLEPITHRDHLCIVIRGKLSGAPFRVRTRFSVPVIFEHTAEFLRGADR